MADLIAFPYDSLLTDGDSGLELDRAINASMYRRLMSKYFTTGVFPDDTDSAFKVLAFDKNIIVKKGSANINGVYAELEKDVTINITDYISSSNTVTLAVALRNDDTLSARKTTVQIITNNTNQLVPPTRNSTIYDIYIAKVELKPNTITVYQSDITDLRLNTEYCGVVTATVKGVDTTTFYDQFQGALDRFLKTVQSAIDGTTAGNLQSQIDDYWKTVYRVGDIYTTTLEEDDPNERFGGTWELLEKSNQICTISDTMVLRGTGIDRLLFAKTDNILNDFQKKYGFRPDMSKVGIIFYNGDAEATTRKVLGADISERGQNVNVLFDSPHSGSIRVNYTFIAKDETRTKYLWKRTA